MIKVKVGMSTVIKEFSRFAHQYDQYNEIQAEVAKRLVEKLPDKQYDTILDLGSGSGEVCKNIIKSAINFNAFTAFDSAQNMLSLHPKNRNIKHICGDFNQEDFTDILEAKNYDLVLSSSSLQWSQNLDFTLSKISTLSKTFYASIFTSNTFKTLHATASVNSPIYTAEALEEAILKYYPCAVFELHSYRLSFDSVREMFRYIKNSGVSSGEKKLSYKETKDLMLEYPLDFLEFEVLFIEAKNL